MPAPDEQILVVPTALFRELGYFQGFCAQVDGYLDKLLQPAAMSFRPRRAMERDPSFKQLIPYVIIRHIDDSGQQRIFQYTRGKGQGESRLHAKRSVGIGGHISLEDVTSRQDASEGSNFDPYLTGMKRELDEEVSIESAYTQRCVGLINDDETEVGRVHLGVVHLLDVEQANVSPRESDIMNTSFDTVENLLIDLDRFETWSQICLKALFE